MNCKKKSWSYPHLLNFAFLWSMNLKNIYFLVRGRFSLQEVDWFRMHLEDLIIFILCYITHLSFLFLYVCEFFYLCHMAFFRSEFICSKFLLISLTYMLKYVFDFFSMFCVLTFRWYHHLHSISTLYFSVSESMVNVFFLKW